MVDVDPAQLPRNNNAKIAQQIEQTADYYPPATYSGTSYAFQAVPLSFLTYYNELNLNSDALAEQYVPISTVPQHAANPKLFAIGVIPPSANVTGRVLDRTDTAVNIAESISTYVPTTAQASKNRQDYVKEMIDWACGPPKGRNENDPIYQEVTEGRDVGAFQKSYSSCGDLANWMLYSMGVRSSYVNRDENGGWKVGQNINNLANKCPAAASPTPNQGYSPGDIILVWNKPDGTDAHAIVVVEQQGNKLVTGEYGQPGGAVKSRTISIKDGQPFLGSRQIQRVLPLDQVIALAQQNGELTDVRLPNGQPVPNTANATKWDGQTADDARRMIDKTANSPLTAENIGELLTAAQKAQIRMVQDALNGMANTPPLRMLVNPQSFSVKGEKIVSDAGWSRNGNTIIEHWGNQHESISASGKVAGFYAIDIQNAVGPGLTRMARNYSQSWQNFQSLSLFYANNGGVHTKDVTSANQERNLTMVGSIYLYYDDILYIGSFESLTVTETDTAPFTVDYSFEFNVRAAFILDNPNVNDKGTYGAVQQSSAQPVTANLSK
jgi:hypothetical protein